MGTSNSYSVIEILTPKKIILNGLWMGPLKPRTVIVWVHGLGSSMFSKMKIAQMLVDRETAVLVFNNRGHDTVSRISRVEGTPFPGGAAHEVFIDCVDDIDGAIRFAKKSGAKRILLAGHSTGCQKSIYWASKRNGRGVKGVILLAPISDYAAEMHLQGKRKLAAAVSAAHALLGRRKKHTLLPESVWHETLDAQRFLSLYSGTSAEEIFTYWNSAANPRTLRSVRVPLLVLLAENDEYADRPAKEIEAWFTQNTKKSDAIKIVPTVKHSFKGAEKVVTSEIRIFMEMR